MANLIQKFKAKRRIPSEAYKLIENINSKYAELNFNEGDFKGLDEKEKLSKLINIINSDSEISRLNSLSYIGSIKLISQMRNYGIGDSGIGLNLCIGENGLFIYDWNDLQSKHDDIPVTTDSLKKYQDKINLEDLRKAIINYTNRDNYIQHVADFKEFN